MLVFEVLALEHSSRFEYWITWGMGAHSCKRNEVLIEIRAVSIEFYQRWYWLSRS